MTILAEAPAMLQPEPSGLIEGPSPRLRLDLVSTSDFCFFCRFNSYLERHEALELQNSFAGAQRHGLNVAFGDDRLAFGECMQVELATRSSCSKQLDFKLRSHFRSMIGRVLRRQRLQMVLRAGACLTLDIAFMNGL